MKTENRHPYFKCVEYASIVLWITLSLLFAAYFVGLNNDSFILYSFIAFVALGLILSIATKYQKHAIMASIALIAVAAIIYATGIVKVIAINIAIIGYYLLVSVVLALFLNVVAESNHLHIGKRAHAAITKHRNGIYAISLAAALFLLFMPFWPAGERILLNRLPYAAISLPRQTGGLYAISFNASEYQGIENSSMGNVRVLSGSAFLKAYIAQNASYSDTNFTLLFNSSPGIGSVELYFMPPFNRTQEMTSDKAFYDAYNSSLEIVNRSAFHALYANSTKLSPGLPKVENVGSGMRNETIGYYVWERDNYTFNETALLPPYYLLMSACSAGRNSTLSLSVTANRSVSVFMLGSASNVTKATSINASRVVLGYGYFLSRFLGSSHMHVLNSTHITINENLSGCDQYAITSPVAAYVAINESQTYYSPVQRTKVVQVPYVFYSGGLEGAYAFLPGSISYLINKYESEITSGS